MTEEEKQEWAKQYAKLCLDLYVDKHGELPVPPSQEGISQVVERDCRHKALDGNTICV